MTRVVLFDSNAPPQGPAYHCSNLVAINKP